MRIVQQWLSSCSSPFQSCEAVYSSVSGLKAHLANCNKVWFTTTCRLHLTDPTDVAVLFYRSSHPFILYRLENAFWLRAILEMHCLTYQRAYNSHHITRMNRYCVGLWKGSRIMGHDIRAVCFDALSSLLCWHHLGVFLHAAGRGRCGKVHLFDLPEGVQLREWCQVSHQQDTLTGGSGTLSLTYCTLVSVNPKPVSIFSSTVCVHLTHPQLSLFHIHLLTSAFVLFQIGRAHV